MNEITQKVRKLLRKCIKFCVVFWKHYADRNKFLRLRQISTLRHRPHLCHHCINGSFCPTGIRVCVICQLFPWRFWITEQINERFFEDCPNAARLLILSKQKRPQANLFGVKLVSIIFLGFTQSNSSRLFPKKNVLFKNSSACSGGGAAKSRSSQITSKRNWPAPHRPRLTANATAWLPPQTLKKQNPLFED